MHQMVIKPTVHYIFIRIKQKYFNFLYVFIEINEVTLHEE